MEEHVINAVRRSVIGKQVKALRREGKLPAIIYGRGIEPIPVLMDLREATRVLGSLSASALVKVNVDGESYTVLVREKQRNFLTDQLTHIDFQAVSMLEKLRTRVPIELHGESPAVKTFNGILVTNLDDIEVEALPADLPERILVDVSKLTTIGSTLHVRDLEISDRVEILEDPDDVVVVVTAPEAEEVAAEEAGAAEPEVIEKGKKEEEEF